MFIGIPTILLLIAGIIALRKKRDILGYSLLVIGWGIMVAADIIYGQNWDRGFLPALIGIAFIRYTQYKIDASRKRSATEKNDKQ